MVAEPSLSIFYDPDDDNDDHDDEMDGGRPLKTTTIMTTTWTAITTTWTAAGPP